MNSFTSDINGIGNSILHQSFNKIQNIRKPNGDLNSHYYKLIIDNWYLTRLVGIQSNESIKSNFRWYAQYLRFCKSLIGSTFIISEQAYLYNKTNQSKTKSKYDQEVLKLFRLLKKITEFERGIKLIRDSNLNNASKIQDFMLDRIDEIVIFLEEFLFIKISKSPLLQVFIDIRNRIAEGANTQKDEMEVNKYLHLISATRSDQSIPSLAVSNPIRTNSIKNKTLLSEFFLPDLDPSIIEKLKKAFSTYKNKKMAILIYLLDKKYEVIRVDLTSKTHSRIHFVNSFTGNHNKSIQGINNYLESTTGELKGIGISDTNYISIHAKLNTIINCS